MATTTNYSWTTPDDTALVKDGASAIRTLGSSVDTTVKALNPGTTAGDLDYYTTSTAKARIAIGTAGQILTVAAGIPSWATPASAIPANAVAIVAASETTSSTSYTDLTTAGPAVTLTTGTKALVIVTSASFNNTNAQGPLMGYAVSGATTIAATDTTASYVQRESAVQKTRYSCVSCITLTAGSNTFTAKYRTSTGTATFSDREIFVINLA